MFKFTSYANARNFILHSNQPGKYSIVLGDDNRFWVVTNREASKLVAAGYEYAD